MVGNTEHCAVGGSASEVPRDPASSDAQVHSAHGELSAAPPLPPEPEQQPRAGPDSSSSPLDDRTTAVFKVYSDVHELAVRYLATRDFHLIPTPACVAYQYPGYEDDHFTLPFFGREAMLAPTSEVHLAMALAAGLERVYDFHTVFRREPVSDGRHLTEFQVLELLFRLYENDWSEILDCAETLLVFLVRALQDTDKYARHLQLARQLYPLSGVFQLGLGADGRLMRLTFGEAKAILRDHLGLESGDHDDLSPQEEAALGALLASPDSALGPATDMFIITHFPRALRSCNIPAAAEDGTASMSFDVIMRGQEVLTGCRLMYDAGEVRAAWAERVPPIDPDADGWREYMAAHETGMPPGGGFGLGINRFVQSFLGLKDIRETVLFPRDASRLTP